MRDEGCGGDENGAKKKIYGLAFPLIQMTW